MEGFRGAARGQAGPGGVNLHPMADGGLHGGNIRVLTRGGQQVCVIVVLVPGKDGQRPRRSEIVVPMG